MDLNVWLPPAVIIAVLGTFNTVTTLLTNKRIGDLRDQMKREHDTLSNKVDSAISHIVRVESKLDAHISNYEIHNMKGD